MWVGVSGQRTGDTNLMAVMELQRTVIKEKRKTIAWSRRKRECVCVFVHLCGRKEDWERDRARKQPLGCLLLTLSSWGGGCSPIPPRIQGGARFPFPTSCTDPWPPNHCQMCPCCWIFPASPRPLFPPSFFPSGTRSTPADQVHPPFSPPALGAPFRAGNGHI